MAADDDSMWLRSRVGEARAARYFRLAAERSTPIETVYRLDVDLRDALRPELEAVEVSLRTRYHDMMKTLRPGPPVWLTDPALPARAALARNWEKELDDLTLGRCSADVVVDRISFGFWARLTAARYEQLLWVPYLRRAFLGAPSRQRVHQIIEASVRLRNRVHHYNTVVDLPELRRTVDDMFWLLDCLAPDLALERRSHTRVFNLLARLNWTD